MLVQLRRVVYLLVLLQCCLGVCLVGVEGTSDPEAEGSLVPAWDKLRESINRADILITNGTACLGVFNIEKGAYDSGAKKAENAKVEMVKLVQQVREKAEACKVAAVANGENEGIKALKQSLGEVESAVGKTIGAIGESLKSLAWADVARDNCGKISECMGTEEGKLGNALSEFRAVFTDKKGKTAKMKQLEERGDKIKKELTEKKKELRFRQDLSAASELVVNVTGALMEAEATRDAIMRALDPQRKGQTGGQQQQQQGTVGERFKQEIENSKNAIESKLQELKKGYLTAKLQALKEDLLGKDDKRFPDAMEREVKRVAEQRREEVEKPGKNGDSSNSPALVHSPLLLLLLCVLGSILVC